MDTSASPMAQGTVTEREGKDCRSQNNTKTSVLLISPRNGCLRKKSPMPVSMDMFTWTREMPLSMDVFTWTREIPVSMDVFTWTRGNFCGYHFQTKNYRLTAGRRISLS